MGGGHSTMVQNHNRKENSFPEDFPEPESQLHGIVRLCACCYARRSGDNFKVRLVPRMDGKQPFVGAAVEQQGHVADQGDGTYRVQFTPVVEGSYSLEITDSRVHAVNSLLVSTGEKGSFMIPK